MKQVWHIFKKDVRHHWPEIAITLLLLIPYVRNEVRSWEYGNDTAYGLGAMFALGFFDGLVGWLIPLTWVVMLVRVIQDESLVGDRQFWVTRPYEWKQLLAAKLLFILIFIDLPVLILQLYLLQKAGFSAHGHLFDLFMMHLSLWLLLMLPVATLASVTSSLAQFALGIVLLVLYLIGASYVSEKLVARTFGSTAETLQGIFALVVLVSVVLVQYSRRETTKSRIALAGLGLVVLLLMFISPYLGDVNRIYPALSAGQSPPVQIALSPEKPKAPGYSEDVEVDLRLLPSGVGKDSIVSMENYLVSIENPDGFRWNSGWTRAGTTLYPETDKMSVRFSVKPKIWDRLKSAPARVSLAFTSATYRDEARRSFVVPEGRFVLPEVGICSAANPYLRSVHCLAHFRKPSSLLITADMSQSTCPIIQQEENRNKPQEEPTGLARQWESNPDAVQPGISPILTLEISPWNYAFSPYGRRGVCPGTPLTFSHPQLENRIQMEVQFDNVRLIDYALKPVKDGSVAHGLGAIAGP